MAKAAKTTTVEMPTAPKRARRPAARAARTEISHDQIAYRAYELHLQGAEVSDDDRWFRAERELRG